MTTFEFGDVVLVDFPQVESPGRKRRPALVILDVGDRDVVLAPITTRERSGPGDMGQRATSDEGLLRASWARLAKLACIEKIFISRKLGALSARDRAAATEAGLKLFPFSASTLGLYRATEVAEHPKKHIREAIRHATRKGWTVEKAGPRAHIGARCGARTGDETVVGSASCPRHGVLIAMPVTSGATWIAAPIRSRLGWSSI